LLTWPCREQLLPLAKDRKEVFKDLSRGDLVRFNASKKERLAAKREKALRCGALCSEWV